MDYAQYLDEMSDHVNRQIGEACRSDSECVAGASCQEWDVTMADGYAAAMCGSLQRAKICLQNNPGENGMQAPCSEATEGLGIDCQHGLTCSCNEWDGETYCLCKTWIICMGM